MGYCNRCEKDNIEVTGTPQYKVCTPCRDEMDNRGDND